MPNHGSLFLMARMVRERCVFTTHTPVAAGNDEFESELVKGCFGPSYQQELGLTEDEFLGLGRIELVLVNDGSPDGVQTVIEALTKEDPRIRYLELGKNVGQHAAVLRGCAIG